MYYPPQTTSTSPAISTKHHDGSNGDLSFGGRGSGMGGGGWPRNPTAFTPSGMPLPSPSGYQGGNGILGYPPPGSNHPSHNHHHGHQSHGLHHHQHPSFGSSGGMHLAGQSGGMGHQQHYGVMMAGHSPPRTETPMTIHWQDQLKKAEISRSASSPHHRARTAAMESRDSKRSAVPILDPKDFRPRSANGIHRKNISLDRVDTPPPSEMSNGEPITSVQNEDTPSEPWTGLDLGGIRLKALSPALFAFTHITALYINHNSLTSLPPSISRLRHLTILDATGNELTSIPPEIGLLHRLKDLLLFDNHLTTLPPEIGTLYQLQTLGIDGNPMEERIRKLLAEEGTTALITMLRDTCPLGPGPPERRWIDIPSEPFELSKQENFTVLTYNILCHHFAPPSTYGYTPSWALDWSYRRTTILQEIVNASADIICLQEVDCQQYAEFFHPELKKHGYDGSHYPRSRARTMSSEEAKLVDGCAVFWKEDKFHLIESQVVEFNQVALQKIDMRTEDMFNRVMSRDNIAVVCTLEFNSGARLMVANSHIYWDHRYRDVKLVQIGMLMEELEKIVERFSSLPSKPDLTTHRYDKSLKGLDIPLILCVDLNSFANSAVYDFISKGELAGDHEDFMSHTYGKYTNRGLAHRLGLKSSCHSFGEMKMTNFTPTFEGAIDWIFYSHKSLSVTSVLGDVDRGYLDRTVGFPNGHFPSDHIPVFAQFRLKPPVDHAPVHQVTHSGY